MKNVSRRGFLTAAATGAAVGMMALAGCGSSSSSSDSGSSSGSSAQLAIAYQYGLSYAPAVIAMQQGLIEAAYKESTGNDLTITWNQMSSGSDINTGITSGSIQVGFMGLAPAITGVATGLEYKIFANISGQEHGLMTNKAKIKKLTDLIGTSDQIALVNTGSFQHLVLAKALADNGQDPHALDSNIVAMAHPDGMSALTSGSVACHLTSSPYIFTERANSDLHELTEVNEAWPKTDSFIVGVAATALHDDTDLYDALVKGIADAQDYLVNNAEDAAKALCDLDGNSAEDELDYLQQGTYDSATKNLGTMATFMAENDFLEGDAVSYDDLVFDNVTGD